jgi:iron complex transport system substrate-binding protein
MLYQVAAMVGQAEEGLALLQTWRAELDAIRLRAASFKRRPKVFFEEWDTPHISGIRWVSELMGIAGGDDIFPELAVMPMGKDRIIADGQSIVDRAPDIIIGSWCGKKFRPDTVATRPGWQDVPAVRTGQIFEIKSADILQPGPAALTDGVAQLHRIMARWEAEHA